MRPLVPLLCASVLVGVAMFEIGVRAVGLDYNLSPNWRYHPLLGWSQVPNGTCDVAAEGRPVRVSFNSMGFRDREHAQAKPPGMKRIVVIGDSFCEAVQVNVEETFQRKLEELLNQRGATKWEVINLGVGDFGTAQEYLALSEYGLAFDPDVVIHQIFPLNDICNNSLGPLRSLPGSKRSLSPLFRGIPWRTAADLPSTDPDVVAPTWGELQRDRILALEAHRPRSPEPGRSGPARPPAGARLPRPGSASLHVRQRGLATGGCGTGLANHGEADRANRPDDARARHPLRGLGRPI